jgi:hypothetical protein
VNALINPVANFQRDGAMAYKNQGNRPNYASTIQPLTYKKNSYELSQHDQQFTGPAISDLSTVTEADFVQPRALWQKVKRTRTTSSTCKTTTVDTASNISSYGKERLGKREREREKPSSSSFPLLLLLSTAPHHKATVPDASMCRPRVPSAQTGEGSTGRKKKAAGFAAERGEVEVGGGRGEAVG